MLRAAVLVASVQTLATATITCAQLAESPWPTLQRDLQRTGHTPVVGPQTPTFKWSFRTGATCFSGIAIGADGTIYFGSNDYNVYALNPDGTEKWRFETGFSIWSAGPTVAGDGTIFIGSADTFMYVLNPDGTEKWRFDTDYHTYGTPVIDGLGNIYFGNRDGHIYAVNQQGQEVWRFGDPGWTNYFAASPAMGRDGRLYTPGWMTNTSLYCHDRDGNAIWRNEHGSTWDSCAIGESGVVYTCEFGGRLVATSPDGVREWTTVPGGFTIGAPAIGWNGTIYAAGQDGLRAFSPEGEVLWRSAERTSGTPIVDGMGTIYTGAWEPENAVRAFNPDGSLKWRFDTSGTTWRAKFAIDADGTVYFADLGGWFYALKDPVIAADNRAFAIEYGEHVRGDLDALSASDDVDLELSSSPFRVRKPNAIAWTLEAVTAAEPPIPPLMDVKIEMRLSAAGGICRVAFRDVNTGEFEEYGSFGTKTADKVHWVTGVPTSDYVRDDGRIELRIETTVTTLSAGAPFSAFFDLVQIQVRDI